MAASWLRRCLLAESSFFCSALDCKGRDCSWPSLANRSSKTTAEELCGKSTDYFRETVCYGARRISGPHQRPSSGRPDSLPRVDGLQGTRRLSGLRCHAVCQDGRKRDRGLSCARLVLHAAHVVSTGQ